MTLFDKANIQTVPKIHFSQYTMVVPRVPVSRRLAVLISMKLLLAVSVLFGFLFYSADLPYVAIIGSDIILCLFLASMFKSKYRYLFLLHPLGILLFSQFFVTPFIELGDGDAYKAVVSEYLNSSDLSYNPIVSIDNYGILGFFKYTSMGVAPVYVIPEYFFINPDSSIYYLWQNTLHVLLSSIVISLTRIWNVVKVEHLFGFTLFAIIGPSFFELGAAPTRHIVTFFAIILLFFSFQALLQKVTPTRLFWFAIALAAVLISKVVLLLPFIIYVVVDLLLNKRLSLNSSLFFAAGALVASFILSDLLMTITAYEEIAKGGTATFGGMVQWPVIGWVVKYVYALLAPFPWSSAPEFISWNYGGNTPIFLMHILSALMGLHLFMILIIKYRLIFSAGSDLREMILYGVIMSLSIIKGSTGFHTYLLIYFPFFAPLLSNKQFHVSLLYPMAFVLVLEAILLVQKICV